MQSLQGAIGRYHGTPLHQQRPNHVSLAYPHRAVNHVLLNTWQAVSVLIAL